MLIFGIAVRHMEGAYGTPVSGINRGYGCNMLAILTKNSPKTGFDRDLGIAGRVMVREGNGSIVQKLVKIDRPSMVSLFRKLLHAHIERRLQSSEFQH